MYRALLHQLLSEAPDLQAVLDDVDPSPIAQSEDLLWTLSRLQTLFSTALMNLGRRRRLKCYIDALDECDEEQIRDMVEFFEDLGEQILEQESRFFVCFASRHYPTIEIHNGWRLILENEQGHEQDLEKYIRRHLRAGTGRLINEVREQVHAKANGVFMWAVLVVDILNKEFLRGRIFAVKKRLQETPARLSDLFKDILRRDHVNMDDLLLCIQWILFAKRPLRREEFYFAMEAGLNSDSNDFAKWKAEPWDPQDLTVEDMRRFVVNSSKGLAELTKSKEPTVQFIHESVRDFLIKDSGLNQLWPGIGSNMQSSAHERLKQCCQNYLTVDLSKFVSFDEALPKASSQTAKELRLELTKRFPFLEYASQQVLYHANEAANDVSQDRFLSTFALQNWLDITNLVERHDVRRHTRDATLLYIVSEAGFGRLIEVIPQSAYGLGPLPSAERYKYPLLAAFANGHRDAMKALLKDQTYVSVEEIMRDPGFGKVSNLRGGDTAYTWAIRKDNTALTEFLLATISDLNVSVDNKGRTLVEYAARYGRTALVQKLLDKGASLETRSKTESLLLSAAENGKTATVQLLLDRGGDIESKSGLFLWTPLHGAAAEGQDVTVQLLVDRGANINASDKDDWSPLHWAANRSLDNTVRLLLDNGANVDAVNDDGQTALLRAAWRGFAGVVQLLLDRGADINIRDQSGMTALSLAVRNAKPAIAQLLLDRGAL